MAGVKGRSGRKGHYQELAVKEVLELSIKCVRDFLNDSTISLEKKANLGKDFVIKTIPQHIIGEGIIDSKIVIIRSEKIEDGNRNTTEAFSRQVSV